jgi:pyruvate dehydrogenase (quinone)/pyruvate decarboxylase
VEIGLVGDMKSTLDALQPMLTRKLDQSFLLEAQLRMESWRGLLDQVASTQKRPLIRPQTAVRVLSDVAPTNALFSMDCGANTHFAARMIQIKEGQRWTGTGMLDSMASALPLAIAGAFAYPDRPSIAVAGDGGFAMLVAELSTAVHHKLNVKVMVLNNDALAQVMFEEKEVGDPVYGCKLGHIDFAAYAEAAGARGFRASKVSELRAVVAAWLAAPGPALLNVKVDPDVEPMMPNKQAA